MTRKQRQRQEKRRKQRVFFSILMILFTGIILTASTYAWFTSNRNVYVKDIDVNVTASTGFQISEDADNWKSIVTAAQLKAITYDLGKNQFPSDIAPVSTVGAVTDDGLMSMFLGTVTDENGSSFLKSEAITESYANPVVTGGNFIAFDLYFRASSPSTIYLGKTSTVTAKGTDSGIKYASRIAFIVEGNAAYDAAPTEAQSLSCIPNDADYPCEVSKIWEPNANGHTTNGVRHAVQVYGMAESDVTSQVVAYKGVKAEFTSEPVASQATDKFGTVANLVTTNTNYSSATANIPVFDIGSGITKVRIYMWVEGQDVDCEDNAASTATVSKALAYNLAYTLDE